VIKLIFLFMFVYLYKGVGWGWGWGIWAGAAGPKPLPRTQNVTKMAALNGAKRSFQSHIDALVKDLQVEEDRLDRDREKLEAERAELLEEHEEKLKNVDDKWDKMVEEHASAFKTLEEERRIFEAEKAKISAENGKLKSKVKLDVGGTIYATSRTTLTSVRDSMLDAMFSGRHALEEDEDGCIFIDRDGATFKLVLEYLRSPQTFSLEDLSKREVTACIAEFEYFGLPSPLPPSPVSPALNLHMATSGGSMASVVASSNDSCLVSSTGSNDWDWAIGRDAMADKTTWKITINAPSNDLMLGIIANPSPGAGSNAYQDPSFHGWYNKNLTYKAGRTTQTTDGWPGWARGDEAIFKLDAEAGLLVVHLKRTGQRYTMTGLLPHHAGSWRICVVPYSRGTSVTLTPVPEGELALAA
jgi:hypothetical protein